MRHYLTIGLCDSADPCSKGVKTVVTSPENPVSESDLTRAAKILGLAALYVAVGILLWSGADINA